MEQREGFRAELALQAIGVAKRFGAVVALSRGDFALARGEVHVLMGSNGCGKSTLCKILAGALRADAGELRLAGRPITLDGPAAGRSSGIATVYQETSLIPTLSVVRNIVLGGESVTRWGLINRKISRRRALDLLTGLGGALAAGIDPDALVADLSVDQRQVVEILKVVSQEPRILVFDESTSSLDRAQVGAFFDLIHALKSEGRSVVFISHRMDEVFAIGDRVTVVRNGETVACRLIAETTREEIISDMVGEGSTFIFTRTRRPRDPHRVLSAADITGTRLRHVSFALHRGEILGLGGLHGQGQSDLLLTLFGALPTTAGTVTIGGRPARARSPRDAMAAGIAYISGDRGRAGAFAVRSILENLSIAKLSAAGAWWVRPATLRRHFAQLLARLRLKFSGFDDPISALSGGNQQKVIVGRWLATAPRILLLDDPTKGIDIQAKRDLYALIEELCVEGTGVILYSSEDAELLGNADRVLVFNSGRIVAELSGERLTERELNVASLAA